MTTLESTKTISIYSNNLIMDIYIQELKFLYPYQIYHSVDEYINSTADFKISFINHLNGYDLPISEEQRVKQVINGNKFCQDISQLKQVSDMVLAFENEMHNYHFDIFQQNSQDNVYWIIPIKTTTNIGINSQNLIFYPFQFGPAVNPYRELPHKLQQIHHNCVKPKYFDALLGRHRIHRDFVYNAISENHLQEKILTSYIKKDNDPFFKMQFFHEPDIDNFHEKIKHSAEQVQYQGQTLALSVIVPIQLYNQTAYSIIAETHADNRYSFFTEKIFKPMLAQRLFIVFSGWKYLENLRSLGFRTFDNVIDESYDQIYNDDERWAAAFEQVKRLCNMNQLEVLEKISEQVQHNYNLVMDTKWQTDHLPPVQQIINNGLEKFFK
jgi:hypothetical protein